MLTALAIAFLSVNISAQEIAIFEADLSTEPVSRKEANLSQLVDNTNLKVRSLLKGRPSITGVPTYVGGLSLGSGSGITFGDGTIQITSAPAYIPASSSTYGSVSGTTSDMAFAGCNVVGSTLSIPILANSSIESSFAGSVTNATLSSNYHLWVLVGLDGQPVNFAYPQTSALNGSAITGGRGNTDYGETVNASFSWETGLLSAGTYKVCLAWSSDTSPHATGTWSFVGMNKFRIKEIRH